MERGEAIAWPAGSFRRIEGERFVGETQNDRKKLIDKMRTNTEKRNRKTVLLPLRRSRRKMQKVKHEEGRLAEEA
jgi:hypothetical protein